MCVTVRRVVVAFKVYDMDNDGFISNGELFQTLKLMVGTNLKDTELQQIVDKSIQSGDRDGDGKLSFQEFCAVRTCHTIAHIYIYCVSKTTQIYTVVRKKHGG